MENTKYTVVETYANDIMRAEEMDPYSPIFDDESPILLIAIDTDFLCQEMEMTREELEAFLNEESTDESFEAVAFKAYKEDKFAFALIPDDEKNGKTHHIYPETATPAAMEALQLYMEEVSEERCDNVRRGMKTDTTVFDAILAEVKDGKGGRYVCHDGGSIVFHGPAVDYGIKVGRFLQTMREKVKVTSHHKAAPDADYVYIAKEVDDK